MTLERIDHLRQVTQRLIDFAQASPILAACGPDLAALVHHHDNLASRRYAVAVVAAMKAGKSTFFNACLGRDLLPHETNACTAAITRVKHAPQPLNLIRKVMVDGTEQVLQPEAAGTLEAAFHEDVRASRRGDAVKDIAYYYTASPIAALAGEAHDELIQNFELVDTPGPNEASTLEFDAQVLQRIALAQLREADALVIIFDYTHWKSEVNERLLRDLFAHRPDIQQEADKIFFVVNKIDERDDKDEPLEATLAKVAALISHHAPAIAAPNVLAVSARQGFLARVVLSGEATDAHRQLAEAKYGARYPVEIEINGQTRRVVPAAEDFAPALLADSRLEQVERRILAQVFARAGNDLLAHAGRGTQAALGNLINLVETRLAATDGTLVKLEAQVAQAKATLAAIRSDDAAIAQIPTQRLAALQAALADLAAGAPARFVQAVQDALPRQAVLESTDRDELAARGEHAKRQAELALRLALNHLDDQLRRLSSEAQFDIDRQLAAAFDDLSERTATILSQHLRFQPQMFHLTPFEPSGGPQSEAPAVKGLGASAVPSEDFGDQARRAAGYTAAGAAAGAALGTAVPLIGNVVGGAVGGMVGFLYSLASAADTAPAEAPRFRLDLAPFRAQAERYAETLAAELGQATDERLEAIAVEYAAYLERQLGEYVRQLTTQLDQTLEEARRHQDDAEAYRGELADLQAPLAAFRQALALAGVEVEEEVEQVMAGSAG